MPQIKGSQAQRMDLQGCATVLGCSVYSVRRYVRAGKLASCQFDRKIFISTDEVERFIRDSERPRLQKTAA